MKLFLLIVFLYLFLSNHFEDFFINLIYKNKYELSELRESKENNTISALITYRGWIPFFKIPSAKIFKFLELKIVYNSESEINIKFIPREKVWELPYEEPFPHSSGRKRVDTSKLYFHLEIEKSPFRLVLKRKNGEIIFDTDYGLIISSQHYNLITFPMDYDENNMQNSNGTNFRKIFGFGERNYNFELKPGRFFLYNRDQPSKVESGKGEGNLYSSHPVYLMKEYSNNFHIGYIRNSNPMEVEIMQDMKSFKLRILGGIIDLNFFLGNKNPDTCIKEYHRYIGGYTFHPFWSFGFHQSRWGLSSVSAVDQIVQKYIKYGVPLDTIWFDIDYLYEYVPTKINPNFSSKLLNNLKQKYPNLNQIFIIEAGVSSLPEWDKEHLDLGNDLNIFIKNFKGDNLLGKVWAGRMFFPDFFNTNSSLFWNKILHDTFNEINFSGIWLDMNEPSLFLDGECQTSADCKIKDESEQFYNLWNSYTSNQPFGEKCGLKFNFIYNENNPRLEKNTICPNALHNNNGQYLSHSEVHNLFGLMQSKLTFKYMKEIGHEYPFILSRATAPGSNLYAAHWSGDNYSSFEYLKYSISSLMNFNLFGIPMTGSDICGFMGKATEELCIRWYQLGVLYPFARSHNHLDFDDKYFFSFSQRMISAVKKNIILRYQILKYYYFLFLKNTDPLTRHFNFDDKYHATGSIIKPLFYEFSEDHVMYRNDILEEAFLIGSNLLVIPFLEPQVFKKTFTFPKEIWYDLKTFQPVRYLNEELRTAIIECDLDSTAPLFLRAGKVIYYNHLEEKSGLLGTTDLNNVFNLVVGLSKFSNKQAISKGDMLKISDFNDNMQIKNCVDNINICTWDFEIIVDFINNDFNKIEKISVSFMFKKKINDLNFNNFIFMINRFTVMGLNLKHNEYDNGIKKFDFKTINNNSNNAEIKFTDINVNLSDQKLDISFPRNLEVTGEYSYILDLFF